MKMYILKPRFAEKSIDEAAAIFQNMYKKITGIKLEISVEDDGISDIIVIGSDAHNDFLMYEMLEQKIDSLGIRYGTDDYCIKSYRDGDRSILVLAGGRGRSTIYAVYDYFERYGNCHYFWDGDIIPWAQMLPMEHIDVVESPRFEYRGLRYFAHRGLKRFQAEHWSFEDWKKEIDWMLKKRLNFFMLRIGMDDVWQRAFPEIVPYPETYAKITGADANKYNDRTDFWTLKYRGELRQKVLAYARDMDLMYPTDCGTMTHWYSRSPAEYLERMKPKFLQQVDKKYISSDTGKVWDFREKENMDNYMRLTETMVEEYDKQTGLFHTIGLGERMIYKDAKKNFSLKLCAYRRILENIRQRYPHSKTLLASWDFAGYWTSEEVQSLVKELDPEHTLILDYTADTPEEEHSFKAWGIVGKFPWIFGLFHAYEAESELRGPYEWIDEQLQIATKDPFCRGMVVWPELAHNDPLILEYLSQNAWSPLEHKIEEIVETYCEHRYGQHSRKMNECWQKVLPFIKLGDWGGFSRGGKENGVEISPKRHSHQDWWCRALSAVTEMHDFPELRNHMLHGLELSLSMKDSIVYSLECMASLGDGLKDEFVLRDCIDIARTVAGRYLNAVLIQAISMKGNKEALASIEKDYFELFDVMEKLLCLNNDYSLSYTLEELQKTAATNPDFEGTLKRNAYNEYCAQPVYELMSLAYREESEIAFEWLKNASSDSKPDFAKDKKRLESQLQMVHLDILNQRECCPKNTFKEVADLIQKIEKLW